MLKYFKYDLNLGWGITIFIGSVIIRLSCSLIKYISQVNEHSLYKLDSILRG
jgi:hypothetical protein